MAGRISKNQAVFEISVEALHLERRGQRMCVIIKEQGIKILWRRLKTG